MARQRVLSMVWKEDQFKSLLNVQYTNFTKESGQMAAYMYLQQ